MKKIRVLHFELSENLGGIETFLSNLMSQIDRDSFQFEFVTSATHPALEDKIIEMGGIIHRFPTVKQIIQYNKVLRTLLSDDYNIIHVHKNSAANIIPVIEAKKMGKKVIVHSHNTSPSVGRVTSLLHYMNKNKLNELADYKLACSTDAGKWLYTDNNFTIMTNGIITERFKFDQVKRKKIRNELSINENQIVYGNIGRFSEQKNHKRLIEIFKEIRKEQNNSILLLVGDGDLRSEIEATVRKYSLEANVIFAGVRNDIPDLLMAMDAFIMPSLYEGLPIVAIEAQASGLQLFLSDTISKETDIIGHTTWFSLNENNETIVNKICNTKYDNERVLFNDNVVSAGYDIKKTADMISEVYRSLCQ